MSGGPVRVLVVDDSAFARKVIREVLARDPRIEVVGIARDGLEALERIAELDPDVLTLDLVMPHLDGLGVIDALQGPRPKVVAVSVSGPESELGLEALARGAVDLVGKPTALATDRLYELSEELRTKVIAAAGARSPAAAGAAIAGGPRLAAAIAPPRRIPRVRLIAIGTSTGGPQALARLLPALPPGLPPIAVALHIPAGFTEALSRRLAKASALRVREAVEGDQLRAGDAVLAPGGSHLRIESVGGELIARVAPAAGERPYVPSVDWLFESAAVAAGAGVLGVVLTGMGDDGTRGAAWIRAAGGRVFGEAEESCVIFGMPRALHEAGLAEVLLPLEALPAAIGRVAAEGEIDAATRSGPSPT